MHAKISGKLLKAEQSDSGNVSGALFDGDASVQFYASDEAVCRTLLQIMKSSELAEVTLEIFASAGRDWETKVPNGRLITKVISVQQQLAVTSDKSQGGKAS